MKPFEAYFSESEILRLICKVRVKIAKSNCKKHLLNYLTSNPKYNYHLQRDTIPINEFQKNQKELREFLNTILPSRKKWVKLGSDSRLKQGSKNKIKDAKEKGLKINKRNLTLTSNDKNFYSLLKTIKVESKKVEKQEWYDNLQNFISEIKEIANGKEYEILKPTIFPKLKEVKKKQGKNECRPICIYSLKERVILSLTNKFLTRLFDEHFQNNSFAFRSKTNLEGSIISHHDCVAEIVEYRKKRLETDLFVAECDMKKFYDTVNHKIVLNLFISLIKKSRALYPNLRLEIPCSIFVNYLNSFAFNIDIPKPEDDVYWSSYGIPNGEFGWISQEDLKLHYTTDTEERIGVPQGGALSGLIANIYLNQADIALKDFDILYQRFCDDMIIIAEDYHICNKAKEVYKTELNKLKLFPHKFKREDDLKTKNETVINFKPFWNGKSKGPYKWEKVEKDGFPWVGFVGYEINYLGEVRVRKKSLQKELQKQKVVIKEITDAIKTGMRKPKGTATESAINRLIGMSVGRIGLDNFEEVSTDLCWKNGFKQLTLNEHSSRQIKQLDRNRSKYYYRMLKEIDEPKLEDKKERKYRQPAKYNKPFSYYYQILERIRNEKI